MSEGRRPSLVRSFVGAQEAESGSLPTATGSDRRQGGWPDGPPGAAPVRRRNRARTGKSSHPDYTKALAYIPDELYDEVRALVDSDRRASEYIRGLCRDSGVRVFGKKPDYSELIHALLVDFLAQYRQLYPDS